MPETDDATAEAPAPPSVIVADVDVPFGSVLALVFKVTIATIIVGGAMALLAWLVWFNITSP